MLGERRADFRAEAGDDVHDALGNAGVDERFDEIEDGERRVLRGLDDAGVAGDERGEELPRRDGHGEVPWRDHGADADGLAHGHSELVGQFGGDGVAEHAAAFPGHEVSGVDGFLGVAARFFQDLAHLASHVARVVFLALFENLGGAIEHFGAARRGHETPFGEGAGGGVDGGVDVVLGGALEDADDFASVGGVEVLEGLSGAGRDPFTIDEVLINAGSSDTDGLSSHEILHRQTCHASWAAWGGASGGKLRGSWERVAGVTGRNLRCWMSAAGSAAPRDCASSAKTRCPLEGQRAPWDSANAGEGARATQPRGQECPRHTSNKQSISACGGWREPSGLRQSPGRSRLSLQD